jgi:hypothetical protein
VKGLSKRVLVFSGFIYRSCNADIPPPAFCAPSITELEPFDLHPSFRSSCSCSQIYQGREFQLSKIYLIQTSFANNLLKSSYCLELKTSLVSHPEKSLFSDSSHDTFLFSPQKPRSHFRSLCFHSASERKMLNGDKFQDNIGGQNRNWTDDLPSCQATGCGYSINQVYLNDGRIKEGHVDFEKKLYCSYDSDK